MMWESHFIQIQFLENPYRQFTMPYQAQIISTYPEKQLFRIANSKISPVSLKHSYNALPCYKVILTEKHVKLISYDILHRTPIYMYIYIYIYIGNFGRYFITSSLSYYAEYFVGNANAILTSNSSFYILLHTRHVRSLSNWFIYITISSHVIPIPKSISIVVFVGW